MKSRARTSFSTASVRVEMLFSGCEAARQLALMMMPPGGMVREVLGFLM
jgi:hypothetical protein